MSLNGRSLGAPGAAAAPDEARLLRAALLAEARPTAPFSVEDGADERTDLVVAFRIGEPRWCEVFARAAVARVSRLLVLVDDLTRTAWVFEEEHEVEWLAGVPRLQPARARRGAVTAAP